MTNKLNRVLYTGVTSDLIDRAWQHREGEQEGFTKKYKVTKLVYFEAFDDIRYAIEREKQIKAGSRQKEVELVEETNPEWKDLYEDIV
jgi:putative endonuclease